jgi:TPR repeat protein
MAKFKTHYDSLNVSRNAPQNVIKAAYKALCQNYHPDKFSGGPDEALRIMKIINAAYSVLSDPVKRAEHDRWIHRQEREHANNETQRMVKIISKSYAAPTVKAPKKTPASYRATLKRNWRGISNTWLNYGQTLKNINRSYWLSMFASIAIFAVTSLYIHNSKIREDKDTLMKQDIAATLNKAKQFVKHGRVNQALPLYLQLAGQGNAEAEFHMGLMYANGQGVPKNDKQAFEWFSKAAKQGNREAQTKLGFMYAIGRGVEQNYTTALYWCYKAAEQGDVIAQYNLGLMYAKGQGVVKDNSLALSWYNKAAAQGDAHAQFNLGTMYEEGVGVAKDSKQAAVWYRKAAKQGLVDAITALKKLDQ